MLVRGIERDVLPVAQQFSMGVIPWSPLAGGWLTGKFRIGQEPPRTHRADRMPRRYDVSSAENQLKLQRADALAVLAEQHGMSLIDMAIAFVLTHPAVNSAIIGPRTMEQLESQLGSADVVLSPEILDEIDDDRPTRCELVARRRRLRATGTGGRGAASPPQLIIFGTLVHEPNLNPSRPARALRAGPSGA